MNSYSKNGRLEPDITILDQSLPMPDVFDLDDIKRDVFDLGDIKRDVFDLERDITGLPMYTPPPLQQTPLRPAIPLERLPSWNEEVDPSSPTSGFIQSRSMLGQGSPAAQYNLPMSSVYSPAQCGCFFNKHSIVHMLGLCRFAKFRSKCSSPKKSSKKKRIELDYGFLERNPLKIYDFNRGLKSAQAKQHNSKHHVVAGDSRHANRNSVAMDTDSMRKRAMSLDSTASLRRGKTRAVKRSVSRQSLSNGNSALSRLKQSLRMHKNVRFKGHRHKVLSGTSRPGKQTRQPTTCYMSPFT